MKNYLIFTLFFTSIFFTVTGQENTYFSKKKISNYYSRLPNFEENKLVKQKKGHGGIFLCNMDSIRVWTNNILKQVLNKKQIDSLAYSPNIRNLLQASSKAIIYFDYTGKINYIAFIVNCKDDVILTDDVLFKLYQTFKRTLVNMKNGKMEPFKTGFTEKDVYFNFTMPLYWWTKEERNVE